MPTLDPADATFQADVAKMLAAAQSVVATLKANAEAAPEDVDLELQARTAASVVNALQIMAAASDESMVRNQRDNLSRIVSDCAINGWYAINEPIADWVMTSKREAP